VSGSAGRTEADSHTELLLIYFFLRHNKKAQKAFAYGTRQSFRRQGKLFKKPGLSMGDERP
jgi:hypothetical protein